MGRSSEHALRLRSRAFVEALIVAATLATCRAPSAATSDDRPESASGETQETAAGTWAGWRSDLEGSGVRFGLAATNDAMAVVHGGVEQGDFYPGLVAPTFELDLERLLGWDDTVFFALGLGMYGRDPVSVTGALGTPSNIAGPVNTFRVYEAWVERWFLDERLSVRAGLYGADGEFDVREVSHLLMNSGFGTGIDLAQTGLNGPCIYPTGCLGIRMRYAPTPGHYLQLAVMDAVAGDPDDPYGTHVEAGNGEGVLVLGETGVTRDVEQGRFLRAALGFWYYSSRFEDVLQPDSGGAPRRSRAWPGLYAFVEGELTREVPDGSQGLSGFLRVGMADPDVNQVEYFASGGLAYTGALPGRVVDVASVGVLVPVNGGEYKKARRLAGSPVDDYELAVECAYWMPLLPWLSLQLDAQYIVNPGTEPTSDDALILGVRTRIEF